MTLLSTVAAQHYSTRHTLWGFAVELASALTAATILADAAVTLTVSKMTYNVSSGTLNHTQPTSYKQVNICDTSFTLTVYYCTQYLSVLAVVSL